MIPKTLFRRSDSSGSSKSRTSTSESTSNSTTPRTSIESNNQEPATYQAHVPKPQKAPILTLPIEILQQIASCLDITYTAPFSLSSRYIYYALGSAHLSSYIGSSKSRFEKRRTIEAIVERAFPGHWFCAWCDKFHSWELRRTSPTSADEETRECAEFNSYLHAEEEYVLRYHHIRLAINHALWGPEHGIPLSTFAHNKPGMAKIYKTPVPTHLSISAKIIQQRFLLHTHFAIILPTYAVSRKSLLMRLWPLLPHILANHRDSSNGHTGLMAAIDNVVRRGWKYPSTQSCATCATDWSVSAHYFPHASGGQTRLVVQSWRDLGGGRNPFESAWRAHGVFVNGLERVGGDVVGCTGLQAGDIRRAFKTMVDEDSVPRAARAVSPTRMRIYQAFMRREEKGDEGIEVRRSRARPRTWRTRSENEEMERRGEEERVEVARQIGEELVRLNAVSGMRA